MTSGEPWEASTGEHRLVLPYLKKHKIILPWGASGERDTAGSGALRLQDGQSVNSMMERVFFFFLKKSEKRIKLF